MNMSPVDFLRTVYVGDRACKAITVDGWNACVRVRVDCISRIRSSSGTWDYYTAEDIEDGEIVFAEVTSVVLDNDGLVPNDVINDISVVEQRPDGSVVVEVSIDSVADDASHHETMIRLSCRSIYLEDPRRSGERICV